MRWQKHLVPDQVHARYTPGYSPRCKSIPQLPTASWGPPWLWPLGSQVVLAWPIIYLHPQ